MRPRAPSRPRRGVQAHKPRTVKQLRFTDGNAMRCRVCGKRRYATQDAAEHVIRQRQEMRAGLQPVEQRAYLDHGWWHTTSREEWEERNVPSIAEARG